MQYQQFLDVVPLGVLVAVTLLVFLLSIEVGFRVGRIRRNMPEREHDAPSGTVVAAMLGLLGFLLAFTFGMAATRFNTRKELVLDEANAIGTAFLRARLVAEPHSTECQKLLREYVETRLLGAKDPEELSRLRSNEMIQRALATSERLHNELWARAEALAQAGPQSIPNGLLAQSLNAVIDLHEMRVQVGIRFRIPWVIWFALYALAGLSMVTLGYHGGLTSPRRSLGPLLLTFAFMLVLVLIIDLDRGQEGFLQVEQHPLFDVQRSLESAGPR